MIGVPGGMDSPLMKIIEEENVNGMKLLPGEGNAPNQKPAEDDVFNAVWIYDSDRLPFYQAEVCTTSSTTGWGTGSWRSTRWSSRRTPCAGGSSRTRGARDARTEVRRVRVHRA